MAGAAKAAWVAPFALCCLFMILFLIAATIILALIPVYLSSKSIDVNTTREETLSAGYASNAVGARSDSIADKTALSAQLASQSGLPNNVLGLDNGNFISATAASKKKRQTINSNGTITCERSTGLSGDIFVADYQITYPTTCIGSCRTRYRTNLIKSLRKNYEQFTVTINFTIAGIKQVTLVFCGIFASDSLDCTTETRTYAYLLDSNNILYQLNPATLSVTEIGLIHCSASSSVNSIALQRNGILWTSFDDGSLFRYNIRSQQCTPTIFTANQSNINQFTMTFLKSSSDTSEKLYISTQVNNSAALGQIDTTSLVLSIVGDYSNISNTYADLAGVNDGTLFGLFNAKPYIIAQINPTNANILAQYPLNISSPNATSKYGFTVYNTKFLLFEGNGSYSDVLTFDLPTNTTTFHFTIPQVISSATSSSCLGT